VNKPKVIFCSKFFKDPRNATAIKELLKKDIQFEDESRMIKKPGNENDVKGLNPLINSIFNIFNAK
jgi:hypothetical protein